MKIDQLLEAKSKGNPKLAFYANKDNWPGDLEQAREFARKAINEWDWKEKTPKFLAKVDAAKSVAQLQNIVLMPMLSGEGLGVLR